MVKVPQWVNEAPGKNGEVVLPDKSSFFIKELATLVSRNTRLTYHAARVRIYRKVNSGQIGLIKVRGQTAIPYQFAKEFIRSIENESE